MGQQCHLWLADRSMSRPKPPSEYNRSSSPGTGGSARLA